MNADRISEIEFELEQLSREHNDTDDDKWFAEHKARREEILGTSSISSSMRRSRSSVDFGTSTMSSMSRSKSTLDFTTARSEERVSSASSPTGSLTRDRNSNNGTIPKASSEPWLFDFHRRLNESPVEEESHLFWDEESNDSHETAIEEESHIDSDEESNCSYESPVEEEGHLFWDEDSHGSHETPIEKEGHIHSDEEPDSVESSSRAIDRHLDFGNSTTSSMRRPQSSLDFTSSSEERYSSTRRESLSRDRDSYSGTMPRISSEPWLFDAKRPHESPIEEESHLFWEKDSASGELSSSTKDSQGPLFGDYFFQLTEKKETSRHTAMEKGLIRQLEIAAQAHNRAIEEFTIKLRQRDEAIKTLEKTVVFKNDIVTSLRTELESAQMKYQEERRWRKSMDL